MLSTVKLQLQELSSQQEALTKQLEPQNNSKLLDFYVRIIPHMLDAQRCSVFIHDPATQKVWLKAGTGVKERGIEVSVQDSVVGDVIRSGRPVMATDLVTRDGVHRAIDTTTGFTTREVICVPIRGRDGITVTGAIEVLNKNNGGAFDEKDHAFLREVTDHFQSVVESIYVAQMAVGMSRGLVATATRALYMSFLAFGASIFVVVLLSVYAGLPFMLA